MSQYLTNSDIIVLSGSSISVGNIIPNAPLDISGSGIISGSLTVLKGITGSLYGTASWAISSSQAATSSYALFALTASYALNGSGGGTISTASLLITASATQNIITFAKGDGSTFNVTVATGSGGGTSFPYTGSAAITGSLVVDGFATATQGFTGSLQGTASWAISSSRSITSSYALTASYVANASSFPYTGSAVITGSLVVTGSVSSTAGFTGSLFGTASLAQTASNAILLQTLTSNATVGGSTSGTVYSAGSSIETVLRAILITYIAPTLGSFSLYNGGSLVLSSSPTAEVSSSYTFNTASFTATADNPNGRYAYSASFTASGASVGNFTYFFGNNVLGTSNNLGLGGTQTINNTANGTVTFTLNGVNPQTSATISQTRTITYVYPYYYGMSATDYSTTGNVSASLTQLIQSQGTKTLSINGTSAYVYFCYPASYADLTSIKDGNNFEVLSSFTKYTRTQNGAPGKWAGISYKIYRSNTLTNVSPAQNYIFT